MLKTFFVYGLVFLLFFLGACEDEQKKKAEPQYPMVRVETADWPGLTDDLDAGSLLAAADNSRTYLKRLPADRMFQYGKDAYSAGHLLQSLDMFEKYVRVLGRGEPLRNALKNDFILYKSVGSDGEGRVVFTGYYEPILKGALSCSETFQYPLYKAPDDIVEVDLGEFADDLKGRKIKGLLVDNKLKPYYSREDIDVHGALKGNRLELLWVDDPVALFFLHIQGSGRVLLPDGTVMRVGYADSNGRPYRSIGNLMLDRGYVKRNEMSMQSIRDWLHKNPEAMNEILNHNQSYVFFRKLDGDAVGNINVPLTPGRSAALDHQIFPKGALAWISGTKPVAEGGVVKGWTKFSRFVMVQDTGGAIKSPGRLDLFFGCGLDAEAEAGSLKEPGSLFFLVMKPDKL